LRALLGAATLTWAYAAALCAPDGGGERDGAVARLNATRFVSLSEGSKHV